MRGCGKARALPAHIRTRLLSTQQDYGRFVSRAVAFERAHSSAIASPTTEMRMKKLGFGLSLALMPVLLIACGGTADDDAGGTAGKPSAGGTNTGGSASTAGSS